MLESFLSILATGLGVFLSLMLTFGIVIGIVTGIALFFLLPFIFMPTRKKPQPAH